MSDLKNISGISANRLKALNQAGIHTQLDLILFVPRRYHDRTQQKPISLLFGSEEQTTITGSITSVSETGFGKSKRVEATLTDGTGSLKLIWFQGHAYIKKFIQPGDEISAFGTIKQFGRSLSMAHPEIDKLSSTASGSISKTTGIIPVYPGNSFFKKTYITSSILQGWIREALQVIRFEEFLPETLLNTFGLPEINEAFRMIHFPTDQRECSSAIERFKFEELFLFELAIHKLKLRSKERAKAIPFHGAGAFTKTFFKEFIPFELTEGQKKALSDIKHDFQSGQQMSRLIQGDVGAGKTIVAIGAILMCLDQGYQTAFMAPTEILAEQHYHTLNKMLKPLNINIRLLTGNQKTALRRDILSDIAGGTAHIIVGTHAIIQQGVNFNRLGLAIIDEQHRFGVMQRSAFLDKGLHPHILVMSATPIPRSLAMTLYGDLDVSIIKGLPGGRKPIITALRGDKKREDVYDFTESQLREGGQAYIVYPLVEESEALDLKDATAGFEKVKQRFSHYKVGLLHGRMLGEEKEHVMKQFSEGSIHILVSTTVIEVGVDVPNASVMIIEHAERFGLSQLHQLRGRIGRGSRQSYCILMADVKQSKAGRERLQTMVRTNDGFEIAETDLRLRGPGDFLGTKQSGLPDFKFANLVEDQDVLNRATQTALQLLNVDPEFKSQENNKLGRKLRAYLSDKEHLFRMG